MAHKMRVRPALTKGILRLTRWRLTGDGTIPPSGILVGAPHTSQWDWAVMISIAWANGVNVQALISHDFFTGPRGWLLRRTGGIPLDRSNPGDSIRALLKQAEESEGPFLLTIAAEGTRSKGEYWKPGFYKIAQQTGLPITLGFVDGPTRTLGLGPTFHPTGDVKKDMDFVRAFYADKRGIKPENRTEPRLRDEDAPVT